MGYTIKPSGVHEAVRHLQAFECGKLSADMFWVLSQPPEMGILPAPWRNDLRSAQQERIEKYMSTGDRGAVGAAPMYVISSYGTPIAWVSISGDVVIPDVTHSGQTSQHVGLVRAALADISEIHLTALRRANGIELNSIHADDEN